MTSKELDKWYTNKDIVDLVMTKIDLTPYDEIIDPTAGNGAFSRYCTKMYDIQPEADNIAQQDFLLLNLPFSSTRIFIGNLPYGTTANLIIKMINHASTMSDTIATIAPKTMTRYSAQKRVTSDLKLITSYDLPKDSFTRDGKICDVPSVFQVWSRYGDCNRTSEKASKHPHFNISTRYNPKAEFVIRGVRPVISNEIDVYNRISSNTRYYSVEPLVDGVEDVFRSIDLVSKCNSAGMPSLSIAECIQIYSLSIRNQTLQPLKI